MTTITPVASAVSVELTNGQPTTTSLDVAAHFGKRHDDVLKRIRALDCSPEFRLRNFAEASQEVAQPNGGTAKYPMMRLTRDGFTFLCMGFTGKEAAKWKEAYITAFNAMEAELKAAPAKPQSKGKQKALPCGLAIEQQDAIKALVKARVEGLPENRRAKAAITCWSSLKSKFGCTYKQIQPEQFTDAISLVARLELEGELLPAEPAPQPSPAAAIRMPLEWLFENNPRLSRERPLIMRPHGLLLSMGTLGAIDRSAAVHLLDQLAEMGADVAAPRAEIEAWRHFTGQMLAAAAMITDQAKRMAGRLDDALSMGYLLDRQSGRPRR